MSDDDLVTDAKVADKILGFTDNLGPNNLGNLDKLIWKHVVVVNNVVFLLGKAFQSLVNRVILLLDGLESTLAGLITLDFFIHIVDEVDVRERRFVGINASEHVFMGAIILFGELAHHLLKLLVLAGGCLEAEHYFRKIMKDGVAERC